MMLVIMVILIIVIVNGESNDNNKDIKKWQSESKHKSNHTNKIVSININKAIYLSPKYSPGPRL